MGFTANWRPDRYAAVLATVVLGIGVLPVAAAASAPAQQRPAPNAASEWELWGVSCTSASACVAVGDKVGTAGWTTLAERWNGTAWAIASTPNPTGTTASSLDGVSCTSASACTAVGNYTAGAGVVTLAERWDGATWAVQSTPTPSDAIAGYLNGVSCTSTSACTGVGWYETSPGAYETLAEAWNGTTWTIQSSPNPSGATASYLLGVSCTAASACTASGYDLNPSYTALAERGTGAAWAIQSTPHP